MKTSDAITYNGLVRFAAGMEPNSRHRAMVATLLKSIHALIVGEYSKHGFEKIFGQNVNWKYFHTIREAWSEIKHSTNPKSKLRALACRAPVANFH